MKNYELSAKLMEQPAGMEVVFCGSVPKGSIVDNDDEYCVVTSPISEIDASEGVISLYD